jgi:hypothetical protein
MPGTAASPRQASGAEQDPPPGGWTATRSRGPVWPPALITFALGLIVTLVLALLSHSVYNRDQRHLLSLRTRDAGSLLAASLPGIETPLASAAELADVTHGDRAQFASFIAPYVSQTANRVFDSVSLWNLHDLSRGPLVVVGVQPKLVSSGQNAAAFFKTAAGKRTLSVIGLLNGPDPRLGYEFNTPTASSTYAAYGERRLPQSRQSPVGSTSAAFRDLDYALYFGPRALASQLLLTNVAHPPLQGTRSIQSVPFGDSTLTLVMASRDSLDGSLPQELPWLILIGGLLVSAGAAAAMVRLGQGRRRAERLAVELERVAVENQRLYAEQRTIAQTLQHALLPDELPQLHGVEARGRYVAGEEGVEVGGDWYDVIELAERCLLVVVGDVSGRGLRAATTMASLRFAIHAYAAQGDEPHEILGKLSGLISVRRERQIATVMCVKLDVDGRKVTLATAGHLPPLLVESGRARFLDQHVGLPLGVQPGSRYRETTVATAGQATLLGFTDGLVERRGETLDTGLGRVRDAAQGADGDLAGLLDKLVNTRPPGGGIDDIAIVGVRWKS